MKTIHVLTVLALLTVLVLAGCSSAARVDVLQTESQSVELGDSESVSVELEFGAGDLVVTGGAQKLLEADFTYNVARLKPEVEYADGTLAVRQPEAKGLPDLRNITDFRNEWELRLSNDVPMDLSVHMGAGNSDLQLAGLSLTGLNINLGAGNSTVDLSGGWARDLDVTIDTGAADITVILPGEVGVRVEIDSGPTMINAPDLTKDGNVYTSIAYGASEVTLHINYEPIDTDISVKAQKGLIKVGVKYPAGELPLEDQPVERRDWGEIDTESDEMPAFDRRTMEGVMSGLVSELGAPSEDRNPDLVCAQQVMYDAWDETNPAKRITLVHEALSISPQCADAYVLLAQEEDDTIKRALELYK